MPYTSLYDALSGAGVDSAPMQAAQGTLAERIAARRSSNDALLGLRSRLGDRRLALSQLQARQMRKEDERSRRFGALSAGLGFLGGMTNKWLSPAVPQEGM